MSLLKALVLVSGVITQVPAGDTVTDWNNIANKPATFPPSTHSHVIGDTTGLQAALDAKAPLVSPPFTGTPTAPTAAPGTNTTQLANTAFVTAAVAAGGGGSFAAIATSGSASDLIAGTVPDARISGSYSGIAALTITGSFTAAGNIITQGGYVRVDRIGDTAPSALYLDADAGQARYVIFRATADGISANAKNRWWLGVNSTAEAGANAGSDFFLNSYNDDGTFLGTVFTVERATRDLTYYADDFYLNPGSGIGAAIRSTWNNGAVSIMGGTQAGGAYGAYLSLYGNAHTSQGGNVILAASNAGQVSIIGGLDASPIVIRQGTADGADNSYVGIYGGGAAGATRGGYLAVYGNEHTNAGLVLLVPGTGSFVDVAGNLTVRNTFNLAVGGKLSGFYYNTKAWDPPSLIANGETTTTLTVTGAAVGDWAFASLNTLTQLGMQLTARVSAANVVTIYLFNLSGATVDVANGTLRVFVIGAP